MHPTHEALRISTPAWPLQSTVAVNPFWFLRKEPFCEVARSLPSTIHSSIFMPLDFYRERVRSGQIQPDALEKAIQIARSRGTVNFRSGSDVINELESARNKNIDSFRSFAEFFADHSSQGSTDWGGIIVYEVGKYASAYLDERQAPAPLPGQSQGFWHAWLESQLYDLTLEKAGLPNAPDALLEIRAISESVHNSMEENTHGPTERILDQMLVRMGIPSASEQLVYLQRLVATVPGWSSQFQYVEWQRGLEYSTRQNVQAVDLIAVRLAYDFFLFRQAEVTSPESISAWRRELKRFSARTEQSGGSFELEYILQLATELSYQESVSKKLRSTLRQRTTLPKAQLVFCIDVRSETIRRHIENFDPSIQTMGFAGFFGLPFAYQAVDEKSSESRLPVLLKPAFHVREDGPTKNEVVNSALASSYFKNLRKNPLSSLLYVELFGALYITRMVKKAWSTARAVLTAALRHRRPLPDRFETRGLYPCIEGVPLTLQVERAAGILFHLGLTRDFADLVVLVGHGSDTTNNAFGSSLDCGACGGHSGEVNARLLANLLNDVKVREGLKATAGIDIPQTTWFLPAVHETVSDEIFFIDEDQAPPRIFDTLNSLSQSLKAASKTANQERLKTLSGALDPVAARRSHNWSEVRPEWGLAGNACFIIAPRERTIDVPLQSRAFLHDYDWRKDEPRNYATLELIMTAPMVVTNWINLQYYSSTVAPQVYGSGSKILHNLINETGVIEGNGGDLRVGLPFQSIHDGTQFIHEPLRLSVFIEAPRKEIERIINQHPVVQELVENEWLHLVQIDPPTGACFRRLKGGAYEAIGR